MDVSLENLFLVDYLTGAHAKLRKVFGDVHLENRSTGIRLFLITFLSIHSNLSAWIMLYKLGLFIQAQVILRTVLESYADLVNLSKDEHYADILQYSVAKKQLNSITQLRDNHNASILSDSEKATSLRSIVNDCEAKGIKGISVKGKFERAGLAEYYVSVYSHWSSFVHNDYTGTLFDCHKTDCSLVSIPHYKSIDHNMNFAQMIIVAEVLKDSASLMVTNVGEYDISAYEMFTADCNAIIAHLTEVYPKIQRKNTSKRPD